MTLDGIVRNGMIVLESGASLPEGTRVKAIAEPAEVDETGLVGTGGNWKPIGTRGSGAVLEGEHGLGKSGT